MDRIASTVRPISPPKPATPAGRVEHAGTVSTDARAPIDRQTFNYGHCAAWHVHGANPEYRRTQALERAISARATALSDAAWALSEGLRHVRQAETKREYENASNALKALREKHDLLGIDGTYNAANMPSDPADCDNGGTPENPVFGKPYEPPAEQEEPEDYKFGDNV